MRVGMISDLHIDYSRYQLAEWIRELDRVCQAQAVELLVLGGDITNDATQTIATVEQLQAELGLPVYFIPGNHDYWQDAKAPKDTWGIHERFRQHPQCLMHAPLRLSDQVTLVGHPLWYNHAIYDRDQFTPEQIERGRYKLSTWQDKRRMDWGLPDQAVSARFAQELVAQLDQVTTPEIWLVTHMVTHPLMTIPMPHRAFDFFNAYIATDALKPIYPIYPITLSVMGHVHIRHRLTEDGVTYVTNCLGYEKQWRTDSFAGEISDALYVRTVPR